MPYLNLDPNYPDHPKTLRLIARLGEFADALPIRLWAYCARIHPKDGYLKGYSEAEIEVIMRWRGEPGLAVKNLLSVGYLRKVGVHGYICHDWRQHEGHLGAFSRRGKLANKIRWEGVHKGLLRPSIKESFRDPPAVPTKEDIYAYCSERKNGIDSEKFFDFYSAKGWMIGKNKMKDWKAAVRTWEKNSEKRPNVPDNLRS